MEVPLKYFSTHDNEIPMPCIHDVLQTMRVKVAVAVMIHGNGVYFILELELK